MGAAVFITIWVNEGHHIEVIHTENVSMALSIFKQFMYDVGDSCGANPFPGMYATINPDNRLSDTSLGGHSNFDKEKIPSLERISNSLILSLVPVMLDKATDVTLDGCFRLVTAKAESCC